MVSIMIYPLVIQHSYWKWPFLIGKASINGPWFLQQKHQPNKTAPLQRDVTFDVNRTVLQTRNPPRDLADAWTNHGSIWETGTNLVLPCFTTMSDRYNQILEIQHVWRENYSPWNEVDPNKDVISPTSPNLLSLHATTQKSKSPDFLKT